MRRFATCAFFSGAVLAAQAALAEEKPGVADFLAQCAACHGVDGIAKSADVPHLAGQHELYLYNQMKAFRSGKRPHKEMRYMSRRMSDADMREIARFYDHLPR